MNSFSKIIRFFFVATLFMFVFASCKKETFEYNLAKGSAIKVDSVAFSPGSSTLIADGQSTLDFIIQVYSKEKVIINGAAIDSMVLIPDNRIPDSEKKYLTAMTRRLGFNLRQLQPHPLHLHFMPKWGILRL